MHRTNHRLLLALGSLALGFWLAGKAAALQPPSAPLPQPLTAAVPQPPVAAPPPAPAPREPVAAPRSNALIVPIGGTQRLQTSTKKRLITVVNQKETVARVQPVVGDPTTVLITGLEPGITRVILTDESNVQESVDVIVQFDVEYLRTVLKTAYPTANIQVMPAANGTIVLAGWVAHAEDIDGIYKVAVSVVGGADRVINAMRMAGVMQVQLDVCVAQVNRSEARQFGYNLLASGPSAIFGNTVGGITSLPTIGTVPPSTFSSNTSSTGGSGANTTGLLTGGAISAPPGAANLFLGVTAGGTSYLNFLQALRNEGLAKLLAKPTVVTQSGRPASFLSGGEQAVPVPAGLGQVGVQFEEFGTRLNVLPIVLGNGKIQLEVEPEVSNLDAANGTSINGTVVPGRDTQRVHATVTIEDGQTLVLGGLIQHTVSSATSKVPVLGDLPFLGVAFSTKSFTEIDNELVVMVTARLVDPMACDQLPKVLPGQETRSPDDFELFLEGILEAPRGPRTVFGDHRYVPAYKNGPTNALFPCAGGNCRNGGADCGNGGAGCGIVPPGGVSGPNPGIAAPNVTKPAAADFKIAPPEGQPSGSGANTPAPADVPSPAPDAGSGSESKPTILPPVPGGAGGSDGHDK